MAKYAWQSKVDPSDFSVNDPIPAIEFWNAEYVRLLDKAVELAQQRVDNPNSVTQDELQECRRERGYAASRLSGFVTIALPAIKANRPPF